MTTVDGHALSSIAAKTVEAIRARRASYPNPPVGSEYAHACIAVEGEARSALESLAAGYLTLADLEGRLRDILAICEAAAGKSAVDAHNDGPLPYPGDEVAVRLPGGGWKATATAHALMPRFSNEDVPLVRCPSRVDKVGDEFSGGSTNAPCTRHIVDADGVTWHIVGCGATPQDLHAAAVWPSSVVAVQQPGGGAS